MTNLGKRIYIFILFESALIFLFLPIIQSGRFTTPVYLSISFLPPALFFLNFFIFRGANNQWAFIVLSTFFALTLVFSQTLIKSEFNIAARWIEAAAFLLIIGAVSAIWRGTNTAWPPQLGARFGAIAILTLSIFFFFSYNLFALRIIFSISGAIIFLVFILGFLLTHYLNLRIWLGDIRQHREAFYLGMILMLELFSILYFVPIAVYGKSSLFTVAYYVLMGVIQVRHLPVVDKKMLKTYISIAIATFILILVSAEWR